MQTKPDYSTPSLTAVHCMGHRATIAVDRSVLVRVVPPGTREEWQKQAYNALQKVNINICGTGGIPQITGRVCRYNGWLVSWGSG